MSEPEGDSPDEAASHSEPLQNLQEPLYRQVPPPWVDDNQPTSQAFRPTKKDKGELSVALGSLTTPQGAYVHHTVALKLQSAGTWALTVGEARQASLQSFAQPLADSPAHGFIDFKGLSRKEAERRSKLLVSKARARGRLHP